MSALALLFFGLSLFSFYTPFQIGKVTIVGINSSARVEELRAEAAVARAFTDVGVRLFSFTHQLLYPRTVLVGAVASTSPRIASVDAMRGGALVIIAVSERKPFAEWCPSAGECVFIDESGFGFAQAKGDAPPLSRLVFEGWGADSGARYLPLEKFALLRNIISSAERVGLAIKKVVRAEGNDFALLLADSAEARFVLSQKTPELFLELPATLAAANLKISGGSVSPALQYFDVRFKDQVVFKRR
ncbi:MAG: hypothetical protein G01um101417_45 [Parcubacteria group bacterium Gr01-1014_17]|nr:MAG: hypothetical protein G01um101417_45 [Parcubacteria group bacterium Gr01-1014_17]